MKKVLPFFLAFLGFLLGGVLFVLGEGEAGIIADLLRSQDPASLYEALSFGGIMCVLCSFVAAYLYFLYYVDDKKADEKKGEGK